MLEPVIAKKAYGTALFRFSADSFFLNPYAIPFLLAGVFVLFTGIYVFLYGGRKHQRLSFLSVCASFFIWLIGTAFFYSIRDTGTALSTVFLVYGGVSFITPSLYWYASAWLGRERANQWRIFFGFVLGAACTAFVALTDHIVFGVSRYFWGYHSRLTAAGGIFYLCFFLAYLIFFFRTLYRGYRSEVHEVKKKQIKLVANSFLIATLSCSDFFACYGLAVFPIGGITMFLAYCVLAYTIIRYKLMDLETVIHKTILWFATTAVAAAPFAAVGHFAQDWFRSRPRLEVTVYFVSFLVAFYFYFRAIQPRLNHFFRRRHANLEAAFLDFSEELVRLKNLDELLPRFISTLRETVYAKQIALYLKDVSSQAYVPAQMAGFRDLQALPEDHAFLAWLREHDQVAVGNLLLSDPRASVLKEEVQKFFASVQALILIPLSIGGELLGFVSLGKKENLKRYTAAEIHFLAEIKSPLTIAISNSQQLESVSRLYHQVQIQNERLKELDRLKSEFLANTSHELRTPLNGILGLVESLLDGADGPLNLRQENHLRMIIESGSGLKELINNLLELSRIESGQEQMAVKRFDVLNVVDVVMALLGELARKKKIRLSKVVNGRSTDVFGDPDKIQRVLVNLAGNAVKFTQKGSVTVRVTEYASSVAVAVEDTGAGISKEHQGIIFERFRQADGGATRKHEGTGLGLAIAKELIELHGSAITLRSEVGKGSVFSFSLSKESFSPPQIGRKPSSKERAENRREEPAVPEAAGIGASDRIYELEKDPEFQEAIMGNGEKILVVDDNAVNREVIKTRLELNRYKTLEASDGLDALEQAERERPDLVILDLMMPRMSGYEFCKQVRKEKPPDELPIIMLTAKTEMGDKIYGLKLGANDYVSKPFNKEELMARVGILLRIRRMSKELKRWNQELEQRVDERTAELVKTQKQLVHAEKLATLGTLAGGVAHEINNPLTAVLTNAQMLKTGARGEDLDSIALIEEGAKRCQTIIQKLLKYARKPDETERPAELDLSEAASRVISFLSYQLEQENIAVVKNLKSVPPVLGVSHEIEQAVTNIVLNARDAIKAKGISSGEIELAAGELEGSVFIKIQDNGIGMSEEVLSKIFDPFFTTKEIGKGTGLGLSITFGIIEKYGGKIEARSVPLQGSEFTISFRAARKEPQSRAAANEPDGAASKV